MKRMMFIAALFLLSQSNADAQLVMRIPPEQRAAKQTEWMKSHLNLNADQVPKVEEINLRYSNKMQEIYNGPSTKPEKKKNAVTLYEKKNEELKGIFTESQYSAYKVKENQIKEKMLKQ